MGMPAEASSRRAWAVTCTLPKIETCEVSISLTVLQGRLPRLDRQLVAALAQRGPLLLDVQRQGVVPGRHQAADK